MYETHFCFSPMYFMSNLIRPFVFFFFAPAVSAEDVNDVEACFPSRVVTGAGLSVLEIVPGPGTEPLFERAQNDLLRPGTGLAAAELSEDALVAISARTRVSTGAHTVHGEIIGRTRRYN